MKPSPAKVLLPSARAPKKSGKVIVWITSKVDRDDELNESKLYAFHFEKGCDVVQSPFAYSCNGAVDAARKHVSEHFGRESKVDLRFRE